MTQRQKTTHTPQTEVDNFDDCDDLDSETKKLDLDGYTMNKFISDNQLPKDDHVEEPLKTAQCDGDALSGMDNLDPSN